MKKQPENRILLLPFQISSGDSKLERFEKLINEGISYFLGALNKLTVIDLRAKQIKKIMEIEDKMKVKSELKALGTNNNAKYAFTGKISFNKTENIINISLSIFNLAIAEDIIDWQENIKLCGNINKDYTAIDCKLLLKLIQDCAFRIVENLGVKPDKVIKDYLESELFSSVEAYSCFLSAKDLVKTSEERFQLIDKAIELDKDFDIAYYEKARLLKSKRRYEEAKEIFELAINKSKTDYIKAETYSELASCYKLLGNPEQAIAYWSKSAEIYSEYLVPYICLAQLYEEKEDYINAEKYFQQIQKLSPTDFRSYFSLARLYSKQGDWEKAIGEYDKQIKHNPYDAWSHSNIANCYLQMGKNIDARDFFVKTIELDPDGEAGNFAKQVLETLEINCKKEWWKFWRR